MPKRHKFIHAYGFLECTNGDTYVVRQTTQGWWRFSKENEAHFYTESKYKDAKESFLRNNKLEEVQYEYV